MAVVKLNKFIIIGVSCIAVIALIIMFAALFSSDSSSDEIILNVLSLRKVDDSVQKAQLISKLDDLVLSSNNGPLQEQWEHVTECLSESCPDDAFFDTVFITTNEFQSSLKHSDLLLNVIYVNRYWDSEENVVEFSKSLAAIDKGVPELDNRKANSAWEDIVDCNNECAARNDLYFDLIEKIVLTP